MILKQMERTSFLFPTVIFLRIKGTISKKKKRMQVLSNGNIILLHKCYIKNKKAKYNKKNKRLTYPS